MAECQNRTLLDMVQAIMAQVNLQIILGEIAIDCSLYTKLCAFQINTFHILKLWTSSKPNLRHL